MPAPTTGRAVFGLEFLYPQFIDILKFQITSRREFEHLKACDPATLTDLERAARFIYLQKLAFGGKVAGQTFGIQHEGSARCLIPDFNGALFSLEWKEALWARFYTVAPQRQRQSVEQYKIVKRA
ncbi:hypothetical protein RvVAT039_04960 [Agrobacterium vitis]|nr:hypothetical protein RvVAT039_04960 [Agrobacterium vitis]